MNMTITGVLVRSKIVIDIGTYSAFVTLICKLAQVLHSDNHIICDGFALITAAQVPGIAWIMFLDSVCYVHHDMLDHYSR